MKMAEALLYKDAEKLDHVAVVQTNTLNHGTEITVHFMVDINKPKVLQKNNGEVKYYKSLNSAIQDAWKLDREPIVTYKSSLL